VGDLLFGKATSFHRILRKWVYFKPKIGSNFNLYIGPLFSETVKRSAILRVAGAYVKPMGRNFSLSCL
jgi:hypothetical protein